MDISAIYLHQSYHSNYPKHVLQFLQSTKIDRKSGKTHEIGNENFDFTKKMWFCHLTENPEKLVKLKMTTFHISRKKLFCHLTENLEKLVKFVKLEMITLISREKM